MNFLAHAVFADGPDDVLFGSLVADFLKRSDPTQFPDEFRAGILMHKELDRHFDACYSEVTSNTQLFSMVRHFSSPVIDVCSDHILATHWNDIFEGNMDTFVQEVYRIAQDQRPYIPEERRGVISRIVQNDWLGQMSTVEGLESALYRLASSSDRAEIVRRYIPTIVNHIPSMEPALLDAIPLIRRHMSDYMVNELMLEPEHRLRWRDENYSFPEYERRLIQKER